MGLIDIGPGAVNLTSSQATIGRTWVAQGNPANDSGVLDVLEVYAVGDAADVKIGTFYGTSTSLTNRDGETIGNVAAGSKQTFSGLSCDVESGDFLGIYYASGSIEWQTTGDGVSSNTSDQFGTGTQSYTLTANRSIAIYGTGTTSGWTGKIWGVTNPAKIWGIPVANISKVGGI